MGLISKNSVIIKQKRNFSSLNKDQLLGDSVRNNEDKVIASQRLQLLSGKDNLDKKIRPKYSNEQYSEFKNQQNTLPGKGTPDLNLSGDLHKFLFVDVTGKDYNIFSDVEYFDSLAKKYKTAFDLSKKSAQNLPEINNDYLKSIHKTINK